MIETLRQRWLWWVGRSQFPETPGGTLVFPLHALVMADDILACRYLIRIKRAEAGARVFFRLRQDHVGLQLFVPSPCAASEPLGLCAARPPLSVQSLGPQKRRYDCDHDQHPPDGELHAVESHRSAL